MFLFPNKPIPVATLDGLFKAIEGRPGWVLQPKHDGDRVIITVSETSKVTVFSRHQRVRANSADWDHISRLPLRQPFTLDGEIVNERLIIVWDFGFENGDMVASLPYQDRLYRVRSLPNLTSIAGFTIKPVISLSADERNVPKLLAGERAEGIVAKNLNARDLWGITATRENASQIKWRGHAL